MGWAFDRPQQVKFKDFEGNIMWGIGYQDEIICACCGGIFEIEEVSILKIYPDWADFIESIRE